jgi:SET domain-containing protein
MDSVLFIPPNNAEDHSPWINHKLEIRKSPISGWGVFAKEKIESFEILEKCPLLTLPVGVDSNDPLLENYRFGWPAQKKWEKYVLALGWGSLYNHSDSPNARWIGCETPDIFIFQSISSIEKDQEILVSYGQSYIYHWK